ncbi:hypothetical protein GS481_02775 [Rhodococcus hoagii]|nr:hypothetical protein [Prescottella equi]
MEDPLVAGTAGPCPPGRVGGHCGLNPVEVVVDGGAVHDRHGRELCGLLDGLSPLSGGVVAAAVTVGAESDEAGHRVDGSLRVGEGPSGVGHAEQDRVRDRGPVSTAGWRRGHQFPCVIGERTPRSVELWSRGVFDDPDGT